MSNANGGPARRDGIVPIPQLTYVKVEDNHHEDLVLVERWKMVPGVVKREPDEASQQVRGLGGPAQAPPSHENVVEWLAQGWPLYGAQPRGLGGPAQVPPVQEPVKQDPDQEAPAAAVQAPVHVAVHNEQALAAAVQAPALGGPVRRGRVPAVRRNPMRRVRLGPRPQRAKKQAESLNGYGRFGLFQGRRQFMPY